MEVNERPVPFASRQLAFDIVALADSATDLAAVVSNLKGAAPDAASVWLVCMDDVTAEKARNSFSRDESIAVLSLGGVTTAEGRWEPPGQGTHVVLIDPSSLLATASLPRVISAVAAARSDWSFTDHDHVNAAGVRSNPFFKGRHNPALSLFDDCATRLAIVRRSTVSAVGGLRAAYGSAQIFELFARVQLAQCSVAHIPVVGAHRVPGEQPRFSKNHRRAVEQTLLREGTRVVVDRSVGETALPRIEWGPPPQGVTITIPSRNRADLLERCLRSLSRTVRADFAEILVIDDGSTDPGTLRFLENLGSSTPWRSRIVRMPGPRGQFNYSALMNFAATFVATPLLLHLNDDVEAVHAGWLDQMAGWLNQSDVGAVGAKLLYPDNHIQHAGVIVSPARGAIEHFQHHLDARDGGYQWLPHLARDVAAVTGACLLTRTEVYRSLGGFDAEHLPVQFNDIDFCLRLGQKGFRVIYEPAATLSHLGSASRGLEFDYRETLTFLRRYGGFHDPFTSPAFDASSLCTPSPELRVDTGPRNVATASARGRAPRTAHW